MEEPEKHLSRPHELADKLAYAVGLKPGLALGLLTDGLSNLPPGPPRDKQDEARWQYTPLGAGLRLDYHPRWGLSIENTIDDTSLPLSPEQALLLRVALNKLSPSKNWPDQSEATV